MVARVPPPDPKTQLPALEQRIAVLVETAREQTAPSAPHLSIDPELSEIARLHSEHMASLHKMSHALPDGETAATLLMDRDANFQGLLGENLASQYYTTQAGVDPGDYAKRFVASWLNSKPHRDNLAFPDYVRTGVGAAIDGNTVYVTQLFAADIVPPPSQQGAAGEKRQIATYTDPKTAERDRPFAQSVPLRGSEGLSQ